MRDADHQRWCGYAFRYLVWRYHRAQTFTSAVELKRRANLRGVVMTNYFSNPNLSPAIIIWRLFEQRLAFTMSGNVRRRLRSEVNVLIFVFPFPYPPPPPFPQHQFWASWLGTNRKPAPTCINNRQTRDEWDLKSTSLSLLLDTRPSFLWMKHWIRQDCRGESRFAVCHSQ